MSKVLHKRRSGSLPSSTETNPRDHVKSISTTVKTNMPSLRRIDPNRYAYKKEILKELMKEKGYDSNLKRLLMEKPRMGYQIEASTSTHDLEIPNDPLPPKEKRPRESLDHIYGYYIELNDLSEPLELRRNQVKYLGPTIEDGEVIDKPLIKFSCMIVRAFINVPIFVGNFPVVADFSVMENIDAYCDEGMGDVIFGNPFCIEICVKARPFDGMITIYNGNVGSRNHFITDIIHGSRTRKEKEGVVLEREFRERDERKERISHPYQKLKSFYKGVLDLGPEYLRDVKVEEWLTYGYVSIHDME
ncbi:hypothetical protein Tco_1258109 [Tanacetum coccineum]